MPLHDRNAGNPEFDALITTLQRRPVLTGAAGHTTIVTEIVTLWDGFGRRWRDRVRVLDPFAATHGLRELTEAELAAPSYVIAVTIRPL